MDTLVKQGTLTLPTWARETSEPLFCPTTREDVQERQPSSTIYSHTNFQVQDDEGLVFGIFFAKSTEPLSLESQVVSKVQCGSVYDSKFTVRFGRKQTGAMGFFQNGFY